MIHGLNNRYLYTAKKIIVNASDGKNVLTTYGTGFFVKKDNKIILVTNRHMIEPGYAKSEFKDYRIVDFSIESYQTFDSDGRPLKHLM